MDLRFRQNFAGVLRFKATAEKGQELWFRHSEILADDCLYVKPLRTARQTVHYICRDGTQVYSPQFTYMGFRYIGMRGTSPEKLELEALALSSQLEETGSFRCSDERLNRLNENIRWSARSNFMDIPTDCPQRDERMGWTGDIAVFARTACWNYDMSRFLGKWLRDVAAEQDSVMGLPVVVPRSGHDWPPFPTACWGDCCVLVPWAEYLARGDAELLRASYLTMKTYLKQVRFWAGLFSFGKRRYIWSLPFQFGDWCAPEGEAKQWKAKGPWIATAYFANSCGIASQVATLLGYSEDAREYEELREKIIDAYRSVFTDGQGKLHKEFQTGYVLPLYFSMTKGTETQAMADNLARLVAQSGNRLATGFRGRPICCLRWLTMDTGIWPTSCCCKRTAPPGCMKSSTEPPPSGNAGILWMKRASRSGTVCFPSTIMPPARWETSCTGAFWALRLWKGATGNSALPRFRAAG